MVIESDVYSAKFSPVFVDAPTLSDWRQLALLIWINRVLILEIGPLQLSGPQNPPSSLGFRTWEKYICSPRYFVKLWLSIRSWSSFLINAHDAWLSSVAITARQKQRGRGRRKDVRGHWPPRGHRAEVLLKRTNVQRVNKQTQPLNHATDRDRDWPITELDF